VSEGSPVMWPFLNRLPTRFFILNQPFWSYSWIHLFCMFTRSKSHENLTTPSPFIRYSIIRAESQLYYATPLTPKLPATLPNHPSTISTFSHLEFIIEKDKCPSIIGKVKWVGENKKWAERSDLIMNRQKNIIHLFLSSYPLDCYHFFPISSFSHLEFIIEEGKCPGIIHIVVWAWKNKKWVVRSELTMTTQNHLRHKFLSSCPSTCYPPKPSLCHFNFPTSRIHYRGRQMP
jgi:hypothetical protein